jgi:hypothetical protein
MSLANPQNKSDRTMVPYISPKMKTRTMIQFSAAVAMDFKESGQLSSKDDLAG